MRLQDILVGLEPRPSEGQKLAEMIILMFSVSDANFEKKSNSFN